MARQEIPLGTAPTGEGGDNARQAFERVNQMTAELYATDQAQQQQIAALQQADADLVEDVAAVDARLSTVAEGLGVTLQGKVDKRPGYDLSQENYTTAEKTKLAGLESSHWRGLFPTLAALQAAIPTGAPGDYADVDAGVGVDVERYLWDPSDAGWILQSSGGGSMTPAQIKVAYESNPDTNAYSDLEKQKLTGIEAGAQVNAPAVTQAEAEAGTGTTLRSWSALRIWQAIAAASSKFRDMTVRDYGAVGGGVTDDTSAFLAALAASSLVLVPPGTYRINPGVLRIMSNLTLRGAGRNLTRLIWPQADGTAANMFRSLGDVSNVEITGITFTGNRSYQTTGNSQQQVCLDFRDGGSENVLVRDCTFEEFGNISGVSGAPLLFGALTGTGKKMRNITVEGCTFRNNSNVPGVYGNAMSGITTDASGFSVKNCVFEQNITAAQNCIYLLGNSSALISNVQVTGNRFNLTASIDTMIELNYVSGWDVSSNTAVVTGAADAVGILIRESSNEGTISSNSLVNLGTGCKAARGISALQLAGGGFQRNVNINDNVVIGWGAGFNGGGALIVGSGSAIVNVTANNFGGRTNDAANRVGSLIDVVDATNVRVSDNTLHRCSYALSLNASVDLEFSENTLSGVGDGVVGVVTDTYAGTAITGFLCKNNRVLSVNPGTPNFVTANPAAAAGNRIENNVLPSGVKPCNPSFLSKFAVITPPPTGGLVSGATYTFSQGSLSVASGSRVEFGSNLDATLSGTGPGTAAVGDLVLVVPQTPMLGCTFSGAVTADNQVRIVVSNTTGSAQTIAAATWRVVIVKASQLIPII